MRLLHETLAWIVIINAFVVCHFYIIKVEKKSPKHLLSWSLSVLLATVLSFANYKGNLYFIIVNLIYLGLIFWILFNAQLNLFTGKPLLYLGDDSDPEEDSILDRFERSMRNPGMTLGLKIILVIICSFILLDIPYVQYNDGY
jgi:hypothetical protein